MFTDNQIIERHKSRCAVLERTYGSLFDVPPSEMWNLREIMRAEHVAQLHQRLFASQPLHKVLREYGISAIIIEDMTGMSPVVEPRVKRSDKYKAIIAWCQENPGKTTTTKEVAEVGDMSVQTATVFMKDRLDYFKKVKRGEYIIRNPAAERAGDKQQEAQA